MTLSLAMMAVLALAALAAFGASCVVAGALWMKARAAAALRQGAGERAALLALADHWTWETDADHRLTRWRAPAQRPSGWCAAPALGAALAEIARPPGPEPLSAASAGSAAAATPLSRQMAAHAPVPGQRVVLRVGGVAQAWSLRGEPRHDDRGAFTGYIGSAVPVGEADAAEFADAALARLLPHLDAAVLLFRRADAASPWRLAARSAADGLEIDDLLAPSTIAVDAGDDCGCDETGATPPAPTWDDVRARLPAEVAQALAQMPAGETHTAGDWRVSWTTVALADDPLAGRLLVLRKMPAPAAPAAALPVAVAPSAADVPVPAMDTADHESFIYSVSHDLRAPIRVVEGFARILKEDYGRFLDRIGNDHTDRILAAAARMNSMIDALLALSRLQSQPLKRQPVDLSQLAHYVLDDLRAAEPEREADIVIEPGLVVQGDPTLIRVAVENLVGNAWKYSGQSPRTRIELRRETLAGVPTYIVADAGAGFDMRFADRLFGVFQRLHSAKDFQGTGVGLASVRRIIRRHGGDIWAESEVGKGARFYFTLP